MEDTELDDLFDNLNELQLVRLRNVIQLAQTCGYEATHAHLVTRLAMRLFDQLEALHHLEIKQGYWLKCAGILHDIGWIEGWHNHHKTALRIILNTPLLHFNHQERLIIGSIARYHRKALPSSSNDHFASLGPEDQQVVSILSAFLRLADGLDHAHKSRVNDLHCVVKPKKIVIKCNANGESSDDLEAAQKRADLLALVFEHDVVIEWNLDVAQSK
jgi:exopolyphosphatase/pppGpp-phosphohydrolase